MPSTAVTTALALATGFLAGAAFAALRVPIPTPPELPGVIGILGIYLGYRAVLALGVGIDLLDALGL